LNYRSRDDARRHQSLHLLLAPRKRKFAVSGARPNINGGHGLSPEVSVRSLWCAERECYFPGEYVGEDVLEFFQSLIQPAMAGTASIRRAMDPDRTRILVSSAPAAA
jgi:hypothetical protein